ncbi:unnamed protein product, partial [Candidula unifasciata]
MEAAKEVVFVLATIFATTECLIPLLLKRDPSDSCSDQLQECLVPVRDNPRLSHVRSTDYREIVRKIDDICQLKPEVEGCVRSKLDHCDEETRDRLQLALSIGDFLCGPRGLSLMRDIKLTSPCINGYIRTDRIQNIIFHCTMEAYFDTPTAPTPC